MTIPIATLKPFDKKFNVESFLLKSRISINLRSLFVDGNNVSEVILIFLFHNRLKFLRFITIYNLSSLL